MYGSWVLFCDRVEEKAWCRQSSASESWDHKTRSSSYWNISHISIFPKRTCAYAYCYAPKFSAPNVSIQQWYWYYPVAAPRCFPEATMNHVVKPKLMIASVECHSVINISLQKEYYPQNQAKISSLRSKYNEQIFLSNQKIAIQYLVGLDLLHGIVKLLSLIGGVEPAHIFVRFGFRENLFAMRNSAKPK